MERRLFRRFMCICDERGRQVRRLTKSPHSPVDLVRRACPRQAAFEQILGRAMSDVEFASRIRVYTLDQNLISLGDVLVSRVPFNLKDPSTWESQAIQRVSRSPFSHAALCVRFGLFVEAIGPGVCRMAIMAAGARSRDNIRLLRLKDGSVANAPEM